MKRYRRKSTKKNKRRRRRRTRKRKGGQETPFQKVHRGKLLQGKIDDCKKKLLVMKKKVNQFRAESTANLEIERENVDHVLEEADKIVEDIKTMQDIIEKHYNKGSNMESLVKELSENKLY